MTAVDAPELAAAEASSPKPELMCRKLGMANADDEECELPTVYELMQEVKRLQHRIGDDQSLFADDGAIDDTFELKKICTTSGLAHSLSRPGINSGRKVATNVGNMSPYKNVGGIPRGEFGLKTPPKKRRENCTSIAPHTMPQPTRVAALTRENISLLPKSREQVYPGSVCGSQKSRTSIRTDGGAVFSRLYQPDFYKTRAEKYKTMRDRRESLDCSFTPRTNRRGSTSPQGSIGSSSQASMTSTKTDVVNVSSRLYDPDYVRKRNARLQRMRQEREMRECTFSPAINANAKASRKKV